MKTVVAHIADSFFPPSETFIYNLVCHESQFRPICIAQRLVRSAQFPFPPEDLYETLGPPLSPRGLFTRFVSKCAGGDVKARRIIMDRKARILHAHFGPAGVRALALKRRSGLPLVTSFYGYDATRRPTLASLKEGYESLFASGELFLAEGPALKKRLMALGCPERRIAIQRIGIPVDKIAFRLRRPKKSGEPVVILFAGRFVEKKGVLDALGAVVAAMGPGRKIRFRLIGDGPLRSRVEAFIKANRVSGSVSVLGFLNYAEYLAEMHHADVFIHPSKTALDGDGEGGAPTSVLEAQASGLPVLSTTHDDIPNIVAVGKSARLSSPGDLPELTNNLIGLLGNQVDWADMGRAGRAFVEHHHSIDKTVNSLEQKYRALLARGPD